MGNSHATTYANNTLSSSTLTTPLNESECDILFDSYKRCRRHARADCSSIYAFMLSAGCRRKFKTQPREIYPPVTESILTTFTDPECDIVFRTYNRCITANMTDCSVVRHFMLGKSCPSSLFFKDVS